MINSRRALATAAAIVTFIFLLSRDHSAPALTATDRPPSSGSGLAAAAAAASRGASLWSSGGPRQRQQQPLQRPMADTSHMTTQDKLAYAYPYDITEKFPAYVWQTWKTTPADEGFDFRDQEASWTLQHPGFVHEVITDSVAESYLSLLYASVPEVLEAYRTLPLPVLKADFFRYLILLARGGIYSDIDTYALKSAIDWIPESISRDSFGLVVGIEADPDRPDWQDWYSRRIQFCQWTIQSKRGHPVLREVVSRITNHTLAVKRAGGWAGFSGSKVIEFTGPALWTDVLMDYFNDERYFNTADSKGPIDWKSFTGMETSRRIGDVVVLPITSFSPGVEQMGSKDIEDPMAYPPLLKMTIPEHLSTIVSSHGARKAIIARRLVNKRYQDTTLTYADLDALSTVLSTNLGIRKGDMVAVSLFNGAEFAALTYAVYKLGAVLVPLNPTFGFGQVRAAMERLGAVKVLVTSLVVDLPYRPCRGRSNVDVLRGVVEGRPGHVESLVFVDNRTAHEDGVWGEEDTVFLEEARRRDDDFLIPYERLLVSSPSSSPSPSSYSSSSTPPLSPNDIINIQFTSGTTATPKAAQLSHRTILNNGALISQRMGLLPVDTIVVPPPLFHCFGSVLGYMAVVAAGATICFPSPAFDPEASLRMCFDYDATGLYGVPTMFIAMLEVFERMGFSSETLRLKKGIISGSSVPESLMRRIHQRLGLENLTICYGQTETGPVSCMTCPDDPPDKLLSSVGRPLPHTAVKIVEPGNRSVIVPVGQRGELATSGYHLMEGYYDDQVRTAEVRVLEPRHRHDPDKNQKNDDDDDRGTHELWLYSGDEASMSSDGYVSITGRIKDLIIRAGENINPLEIENSICQMPSVRDVSVVGVPCPRLGEAVAAFVRTAKEEEEEEDDDDDDDDDNDKTTAAVPAPAPALTQDAVRDWVRARLSNHLVPKHVFFWPDEFPKTASGKVQKFKLRQEAVERLKKEE
ncbi:hypothetical protein CP532_0551 [Ophiocordyceps camponoti-leonardi (nom. inval.)]|nr:hypothetical protein CP532_0551 [Ophiocordyceps camponoti-leonardi (nom. inval.)]